MLYCKKKAPHRDVKMPDSVFKYILMSRSKIVSSNYSDIKNGKKAHWRQWLDEKKENQELGHNVSRKIRQLYNKNVKLVKMNQDRIEARLEKLESVKRILKELGFNENNLGWRYEEKLRQRITEINEGFPEKDVIQHLEASILNLKNTIVAIQRTTIHQK